MKWLIAGSIMLFIFGYTANALVGAFTEAHGKRLPPKYRYPAVIFTTILLFGLMLLWARSCPSTSEEIIAPNGQTATEHYEPRF